jgi:hypothetical protein
MYYGGIKFSQREMILLTLDNDAACTSLNGHSAIKIAVFVLL